MRTANLDRVGPWTSVLIGLPCGLLFTFFIVIISLFPPIDLGLATIGGGLIWHPITWIVVMLTFLFLLWTAGKKIKKHLDRQYSIVKTSFLFTLFINCWLFGLFIPIFIIGGLIFYQSFNLWAFGIALGLTVFAFIVATVFTTFTIGLVVIAITKNKINKRTVL